MFCRLTRIYHANIGMALSPLLAPSHSKAACGFIKAARAAFTTTQKNFQDGVPSELPDVRLPSDQSPLQHGLKVIRTSKTTKTPHTTQEKGYPEVELLGWGSQYISLRVKDAQVNFPHLWLRDNCRCSTCVNQDTMQRAFDTFSIPIDIAPKDVSTEQEGVRVTWSNDDHVSLYTWRWLRKRGKTPDIFQEFSTEQSPITMWGSEIKENPPSVHFDEIMADDKGVGKWTAKIREYGFCFVDGCPISPEATKTLLERIAFIRITHYDTAYTSLPLAAHTDTTYFTDPAGIQMFHLLSHISGSGGQSLLVDGYKAAHKLYKEDIDAYRWLAKVALPWHASGNEGITITPSKSFPVFSFASSSIKAFPQQIRWNNDDRVQVALEENGDVLQWYTAARKWNESLKAESMEYWEHRKLTDSFFFRKSSITGESCMEDLRLLGREESVAVIVAEYELYSGASAAPNLLKLIQRREMIHIL
ncbi:hypothetical protein B7494_g3668 [Chlorociboria aeruginascens]|nr:hypothetical protein B7494_g3668 [Chlorociboria aeruginascens]